jgi:regulatory protein
MASRSARLVGRPPDTAALHEAAVAYLARYAATEAGLRRVLERRVARWAGRAVATMDAETIAAATARAHAAIAEVVRQLAAAGAVSDAAFAVIRARVLLRGGRSRQAVAAELAARGVRADTARAALEAEETDELSAALVLARRRRIGPFRDGDEDRRRELAMLARAGFSPEVANQALRTPREEAEEMVTRLRRNRT